MNSLVKLDNKPLVKLDNKPPWYNDLKSFVPYVSNVAVDGSEAEFYFPICYVPNICFDTTKVKKWFSKIEIRVNRVNNPFQRGHTFQPPEKHIEGHWVKIKFHEEDRTYCLSIFSY